MEEHDITIVCSRFFPHFDSVYVSATVERRLRFVRCLHNCLCFVRREVAVQKMLYHTDCDNVVVESSDERKLRVTQISSCAFFVCLVCQCALFVCLGRVPCSYALFVSVLCSCALFVCLGRVPCSSVCFVRVPCSCALVVSFSL